MKTTNLLFIIMLMLSLVKELQGQCLNKNVLPETVSINCADNQQSYITIGCTQGKIYRSVNGEIWDSISSPVNTDIKSISFRDTMNGFIVSTNKIFGTTDGGFSWNLHFSAINELNALAFNTSGTGFCTGKGGQLLRVNEQDSSWENLLTGENRGISAITFHNAVGFAAGDNGLLVKTSDNGNSWKLIYTGFSNSFFSIALPAEDIIYLSGENGLIIKSSDGGNSWSALKYQEGIDFRKLLFLNETTGYAVGKSGYIEFTSDGGESWRPLINSPLQNDLNSVAISHDGYLLAFGTNGNYYRSTQNLKIIKTSELSPDGISLSAIAGGIASWTSNGTGHFIDSRRIDSTRYIPSKKDIEQGTIKFTLATQDICRYETNIEAAGICKTRISAATVGNFTNAIGITNDTANFGGYFWDFGDNSVTTGSRQSHLYSAQGVYKVLLNYRSENSGCNSRDSLVIPINAITSKFYSIAGKVYAGTASADAGQVYLYEKMGDEFHFLEKKTVNSGYYTFTNIPPGYYIVHFLPDTASIYKNSYQATYCIDAAQWAKATIVQVEDADATAGIVLLEENSDPTQLTGIASIKGKVWSILPANASMRISQGKKEQVEGAVITLYTVSGSRLTSTYADPYGNYNFKGLSDGEYWMKVEYPGTKMDSVLITVQGGHEVIKDLKVDKDKITGIVAENTYSNGTLYCFPNPATDKLMVSSSFKNSCPMKTSIKIVSLTGMIISEKNTDANGGNETELSVSDLNPGIYFIQLEKNGEIITRKFTKN